MSKRLRSNKKKQLKCTINSPVVETFTERAKRESHWHNTRNIHIVKETINSVRDSLQNTYDNFINHNVTPEIENHLEQATHRSLQNLQRLGVINSVGRVQALTDPSDPSTVIIKFSVAPTLTQEYINIRLAINN